jgi:hypothetical protein
MLNQANHVDADYLSARELLGDNGLGPLAGMR